MSVDGDLGTTHNVLRELGHEIRRGDGELRSRARISPEMHAPGTSALRTSILAVWADTLIGLLAAEGMTPRIPVTLELDVHLYAPAPGEGVIRGVARTMKEGRSVFVGSAEFTSEAGEPIALAAASFMAAPDPGLNFPTKLSIDLAAPESQLSMPFAQRAGCEIREPGVAVLPRSEEGLNSSNTVNGGLIALAAEESALSLSPGATLCSLGLRYLQPVRVGPVIATAKQHRAVCQVELRDAGSSDRLAAAATTRTFVSEHVSAAERRS